MSSRCKARERRQRRRRQLARGRHPAGTAVTVLPAPMLSGQGLLVVTIIITITGSAPGLSGRGCLCAFAHDLDDYAPDYRTARHEQRLAARPDGWPPGLMEAGAPRGSRQRPWACVWWSDITGCGYRAYATFWPTKEAAEAAAAPYRAEKRPASVVDVTRTAKIESNDRIIKSTTRPMLEHPYPPEQPNLDPLRITSNGYDGWKRAAARPVGSTFHQ
jgi:hypothetical protein